MGQRIIDEATADKMRADLADLDASITRAENLRQAPKAIRLKGELDFDLTRIGLKEGDVIRNISQLDKKTGAVHFDCFHVITNHCVVWPENYDIIE